MAKKRKLNAGILDTNIPDDLETKSAGEGGSGQSGPGQNGPGMGGFWGGSALNMMQAKLKEVQASIADGVMQGVVAIELQPSQIMDEAGTDRLGDWERDEAFKALVADIKRRGQKQPVRVRPADPNWTADPNNPYVTDGQFVLQSGRRRMAAMAKLGLPVKAVISTEAGDANLADLEERFLENTMRKDLSGFEQLLSIGMLAGRYQDMSQTEIAERLQVPQGDVSLGLSCVENFDQIKELVDIENTPKRAFREILPRIKKGLPIDGTIGQGGKPHASGGGVDGIKRQKGFYTVEAVPAKGGFTMKVKGFAGDLDYLEKITDNFVSYLAQLDADFGKK